METITIIDDTGAPAPTPRDPGGPLVVIGLVVAAMTFALGFLLGSGDRAAAPPGTPTTFPPVATTATTTTSTVEQVEVVAPSPSTTAAATVPPPRTLEERVPGFDGLVAWVSGPRAYRWQAGEVDPRSVALDDAIDVQWDAGGAFLAYTAPGSLDYPGFSEGTWFFDLYAGSMFSQEPIALGVTQYVWHQAEEGRLAYIGASGDGLALFEIEINRRSDRRPGSGTLGATARKVADLPAEAVVPSVAAFGDWGFLVTAIEGDGTEIGPVIRVYARDGSVDAELRDYGFWAAAGPGRFVVTPEWYNVEHNTDFDFVVVDTDLREVDAGLDPSIFYGAPQWSRDGRSYAAWIGEDLVVSGPDGEHHFDARGWIGGFDAANRFVVTIARGETWLTFTFIDTATGETYDIPGVVSNETTEIVVA